jgi:hypothetical protein
LLLPHWLEPIGLRYTSEPINVGTCTWPGSTLFCSPCGSTKRVKTDMCVPQALLWLPFYYVRDNCASSPPLRHYCTVSSSLLIAQITSQRLGNDGLPFGGVLRMVMGYLSRTFHVFCLTHIEHAMLDRRLETDLFLTPPFYWLPKLKRVHS